MIPYLPPAEVARFAVLDYMPMGAMVLDSEYTVLFWNKCLENWTRIAKDEIEGKDIRSFFSNFLDPKIALRLEIVFQGGPPAVFSSQLHKYLIPAPFSLERMRLQHTVVNAVRRMDGCGYFAFFNIDDVTEVHKRLLDYSREIENHRITEKALHEAKNLAEAASKAKSEFLATMSHEIRTPLNGVLGMLQLLKHSGLSAEQEKWVATALQSGASLMTILGDVLDLSMIEAGAFELQETSFTVADLLQTLVGAFADLAAKKNLTFGCCVEKGVPPALAADAGRLRQILFNLVGNAFKFTEKGAVQVTVSPLQRQGEYQWLLFCVEDTGIGIPEDKLDYVFEPFTQVDGSYSRNFSGLGLGLGIVKRLVALMGGSLVVDSQEGAGSAMYCSLRVRVLDGVVTIPAVNAGERLEHVRPLRILLAEDEQVNQIVITRLLGKLGHSAQVANNGREVLEALAAASFDLLIMDIQMPEMDGVETTRRIRQGEVPGVDPDIPILAVTAHALVGDRQRFLDSGMDDYLAKPIKLAELSKALGRIAARQTR